MSAEDIDAGELKARIKAGSTPVIVDVRSGAEFRAGHVPGAAHVPFWTMPWRGAELRAKKDDEVVLYCGHGPRAMMAAVALRRQGFTRVRLLRGHWANWKTEGLKAEG